MKLGATSPVATLVLFALALVAVFALGLGIGAAVGS